MLLRGGATRTRHARGRRAGAPAAGDAGRDAAAVEATARRFHHDAARGAMTPRRDGADHDARSRCDRRSCKRMARAARALGMPLHSHLSETVSYIEHCRERVRLPADRVRRRARLARPRRLVRAPRAPRRIRDARCSPRPAPASRTARRATAGWAAASRRRRRWRALGVPVSLGVDGAASNEAADMLSEAHHCWLVHRAHAGAASRRAPEGERRGRCRRGARSSRSCTGARAGGAQVLGFDGVGTLAARPGRRPRGLRARRAALLRPARPGIGPVASGGRPHLRGCSPTAACVVENGAIPGLDMAELRAEARAAVQQLLRGRPY